MHDSQDNDNRIRTVSWLPIRPRTPRSPYSPWNEADDLGLHVRYAPLTDSWSWWIPSRRLIVLAERMTEAEARCALSHEVQHADNGDTEPSDYREAIRQEVRADEAAARKLIPVVDLHDILKWTTDPVEAAHELNVTEHMMRVRFRVHRRDMRNLDTLKLDT